MVNVSIYVLVATNFDTKSGCPELGEEKEKRKFVRKKGLVITLEDLDLSDSESMEEAQIVLMADT